MEQQRKISRRGFLGTAALAAGGLAALPASSYARVIGANDRIHLGIIGCGGISSSHLSSLLPILESDNLAIDAICDVFGTHADNYAKRLTEAGHDPKVFAHYEDVLAMPEIDYVLVAVPEHSHAHITLDALDAGKHVYCEKPLTHTISEGRRVVKKVRDTGLLLQVGVQGMSDDSYSSAHEAIKAGKLGIVVEAQIDYMRNYRGEALWRGDVKSDMPKPDNMDWAGWIGPARARPWDPHRFFEWRCYRDYSGGIATDLFVHRLTRILKACGLTYPERVSGMGGIYMWPDGRDLPDSFEMLIEYPAVEGITNGMTVNCLGTMANERRREHCIRGNEATLVFTDTGWDIVKEKSGEVIQSHKKTGSEDIRLHHQNLHNAIRNGAPLNCPVELGLYGVIPVCLANQSWTSGEMMHWRGPNL